MFLSFDLAVFSCGYGWFGVVESENKDCAISVHLMEKEESDFGVDRQNSYLNIMVITTSFKPMPSVPAK